MYPQLQTYISHILKDLAQIPAARREKLRLIREFIHLQIQAEKTAELIFICTHNSRRSHFGHIWAQTFANYFDIGPFNAYSGGTEATAFHAHAIRAVEQAGFRVIQLNEGSNPLYRIRTGKDDSGMTAFSKIFTHPANPQQDFCAVMTCSDADENCPLVTGATKRVAIPYEDPKQFDKSPLQDEMYAQRCRQIATEIAWIFQP